MNLYQRVFHSVNCSPEDCCPRTLVKAKTFPALPFRTESPVLTWGPRPLCFCGVYLMVLEPAAPFIFFINKYDYHIITGFETFHIILGNEPSNPESCTSQASPQLYSCIEGRDSRCLHFERRSHTHRQSTMFLVWLKIFC